MFSLKPVNIPMKLRLYDEQSEKVDNSSSRSPIGKLLYITITSPDISLTIKRLSQFMDKHRKIYWYAAIMVIKYLQASLGKELLFKKNFPLILWPILLLIMQVLSLIESPK